MDGECVLHAMEMNRKGGSERMGSGEVVSV